MAWVELHQSLPTHRKTLALADALNIEPVVAVGHLACLWLWSVDNAQQDGFLMGASPRTIARAAGWKRDPVLFVDALADAGFLDGSKTLHNWEKYAGRLMERRRKDAERKRTERAITPGSPPDVPPPSNGHPKDVPLMSGGSRARVTVPNRTVPNHTVPETTPVAPSEGAHTDAAKPKETRRKKTAGEHTPITEHDIDELLEKFTPLFGAERKVRLSIDKALNSRARSTWLDERRGVDVWLRGDLEKLREAGKAPRFPMAVPEPADDDGPFEPEVRPMCGTCGVSASVDLAGTTCMACMVKQHQAAKGLRTAG